MANSGIDYIASADLAEQMKHLHWTSREALKRLEVTKLPEDVKSQLRTLYAEAEKIVAANRQDARLACDRCERTSSKLTNIVDRNGNELRIHLAPSCMRSGDVVK